MHVYTCICTPCGDPGILFALPSIHHLGLSQLITFYTHNSSHPLITNYTADIVPGSLPLFSLWIRPTTPGDRDWCYLFFIDEDTEAKRTSLTCPQSHNRKWTEVLTAYLLTIILFERPLFSQHSFYFLPLALVLSVTFSTWHSCITFYDNSPKW